MTHNQNRRDFLKSSAAAATVPFWFSTANTNSYGADSPNERPVLGCIGTGSRWNAVGPNAMAFADCIAVCDADANHMEQGRNKVKGIQGKKGQEREVQMHEDYRKILDNKEIDVVTIVTPDHWHSKIAIEAMQAGKDVYCEKPLTLTIQEGKQIRKVLDETKRVFQVGTQQRSEMALRFLTAVAMVKDGRIGKVEKVQCAIGGAPTSGPIPKVPVPNGLNWDLWQGQTPLTDYRHKGKGRGNSRCHYEFRWWYEYSGGKMTDWGAHHVDIAQWMIGMDESGPLTVEPVTHEHPVPFDEKGMPTKDDQYNAATKFLIKCTFPNDVVMGIRHDTANGIRVVGTEGEFFVSRGNLVGKPVDDLKKNPLPSYALKNLYKGHEPGGGNAHMRNFFECIASREQPISDVHTHHRAMTTCHLANIAIRLNRTIKWDPKSEQILDDKEAAQWISREQRKGYEIDVSV